MEEYLGDLTVCNCVISAYSMLVMVSDLWILDIWTVDMVLTRRKGDY